jgi:phage repressor protein C with HTH and peptisase S24 domain
MPAQVISMGDFRTAQHHAAWSLLEIARPGNRTQPLGVLLADAETDQLTLRLLPAAGLDELEEQAADILDFLAEDLAQKAREMGATQLLASLEESLSGFFRISDRTEIAYSGDPQRKTDKLFDEYVDGAVRPYITHIPIYQLRAAATKFGEGMNTGGGEAEDWVRVPAGMRVTENMFAVWVVGRSMEPLIQDGDLCAFRANVTGSRQGKRLLIEKFDETDFASRYTVKRYNSVKEVGDDDQWSQKEIRLEPLNPEFEAFNLTPDKFRVVGEFVGVLESA